MAGSRKAPLVVRPARKLVQVQLVATFAEMTQAGDIGELGQPVQLTITGAEWQNHWATAKSRDVFKRILDQLKEVTS